MLLTAASMVGSIIAIVGGMAVALVLRSLLDAPVPVAAVAGTLVGLGLAAAGFAYQVRRFRRAAAVVPEPYEGQGPACRGDLPGDQTTRAAPGSRPRRPNLQPIAKDAFTTAPPTRQRGAAKPAVERAEDHA